MLPLNKILDLKDYESADLNWAIHHLEQVYRRLAEVGLADQLPTKHRMWEYGQGLRAYLRSKPGGRVLEVGGSTSLFMPAMAALGHSGDELFIAAEAPEWQTPDAITRQERQFYTVSNAQKLPHLCQTTTEGAVEHAPFDFISCISVIENLPYEGPKQEQGIDPISGAVWHDGHTFMQEFVSGLEKLLAPGGVLFVTSDIGSEKDTEDGKDPYPFHWMRPPGIWNPSNWFWLTHQLGDPAIGGTMELEGGVESPLAWHGPAYEGYSFASACWRRPE